MRITVVPARYADALIKNAESLGLSRDRILMESGLSKSVVTSLAPIPFTSFIKLANTVMEGLQDESCGLLPNPIKPGSFALLCQSCIDCKTLGHFLKRRIRSLRLISNDVRISFYEDGGQVFYQVGLSSENALLGQHIAVIILALVYKMSSWGIRERLPLTSVKLVGEKGKYARDYDNLFDVSVEYNQSINQLTFPVEFLESPILQDTESMKDFLREPAFNLMSEYGVRKSLVFEIRELIGGVSPVDFPSLEEVASHFNISSATLRRRLQEENTTYQSIKDQQRRDIAILILARERNVKEAAFAAGFSDPTSFFRAFKRWTGVTPSKYISDED